ncbi:MAG: molybdopterin dinucleotide binding domain-containing protein, partial [Syntrophomonadaceae bacterium]|nr:molybdopterin dinucleotide binding domain-containing protein [Syntrophomonadaceae bacterium]
LNAHKPHNELEINPVDAEKLNITDKEMVKVVTRRGSINIRAKISDILEPGVIFTTFHFAEAAANRLTNADSLDPIAKIPEYKVCAARVEKI